MGALLSRPDAERQMRDLAKNARCINSPPLPQALFFKRLKDGTLCPDTKIREKQRTTRESEEGVVALWGEGIAVRDFARGSKSGKERRAVGLVFPAYV